MSQLKLVSIREASKILGVSPGTLRRWEKEGRLSPFMRTFGNHRRFDLKNLLDHLTPCSGKCHALGLAVGYARVSSHDQKEDLKRQEATLENELKAFSQPTCLISDLGSGMNFQKRGLRKLLSLLLGGEVKTLVLTHKDRLLRFDSELIFLLCEHVGTKVVILDEKDHTKSDEEAFAADVIELMTVFSARLYGKRSQKNRKAKEVAKAA